MRPNATQRDSTLVQRETSFASLSSEFLAGKGQPIDHDTSPTPAAAPLPLGAPPSRSAAADHPAAFFPSAMAEEEDPVLKGLEGKVS